MISLHKIFKGNKTYQYRLGELLPYNKYSLKNLKKVKMKKVILSIMVFVCSFSSTFSQDVLKVTDKEKTEVINNLCKLIENEYVIAETGILISKKINENLKTGKYNSIKDVIQMCDVLTHDLRTISKDEHFDIMHAPGYVLRLQTTLSKADSLEMENTQIKEGQKNNFGFKELSIMEGNIGYLNLTSFHDLRHAKETITSAMNFLTYTEAIIIDLRNNTGGSLDMPPYLASYFLGDDIKVLLQFIDRNNKVNSKTETTQQLDGKRLFGKPLYILTSNETVSAAEAFIYSLKNRKTAIVIGETTKGAANPNEAKVLNENFLVLLPNYRPIDPLTGTNWEGTGIQPDIKIMADKGKETAHIYAIENIARQSQWGIIGNATPNNWDFDQPMTYDEASKTWKITLDLKAGEFKFRANSNWNINLGDKKGDGVLKLNGNNLKVAANGNYTVSLMLNVAGNYTYKLIKN
jgi:retinol-binding protein 3